MQLVTFSLEFLVEFLENAFSRASNWIAPSSFREIFDAFQSLELKLRDLKVFLWIIAFFSVQHPLKECFWGFKIVNVRFKARLFVPWIWFVSLLFFWDYFCAKPTFRICLHFDPFNTCYWGNRFHRFIHKTQTCSIYTVIFN